MAGCFSSMPQLCNRDRRDTPVGKEIPVARLPAITKKNCSALTRTREVPFFASGLLACRLLAYIVRREQFGSGKYEHSGSHSHCCLRLSRSLGARLCRNRDMDWRAGTYQDSCALNSHAVEKREAFAIFNRVPRGKAASAFTIPVLCIFCFRDRGRSPDRDRKPDWAHQHRLWDSKESGSSRCGSLVNGGCVRESKEAADVAQ